MARCCGESGGVGAAVFDRCVEGCYVESHSVWMWCSELL